MGAGEMEYCTLLGHLLHIDLAVYFAALRTFAHFLEGRCPVTARLALRFSALVWPPTCLQTRAEAIAEPSVLLRILCNELFVWHVHSSKSTPVKFCPSGESLELHNKG